ncbi:SMI1/KNR4 family protein [Streptomyces sp. NPDC059567]|uniref:SMI1/KNR4 family protein n=1 Tax=Streptomyces sp. NPDC059567 TaxID=3346867 RepID=UPI0036CFA968
MTIDWTAEARRVDRGHRFDELSSRTWEQYGDPAPPPLSASEVREAEEELGITFPAEYRNHLLRESAGGRVNRLHRGAQGWVWHGDSRTNYDLLTTEFPHPESYRAYEDELDEREPLREHFADDGTFQRAWDDWDAEYEVHQERKTAGAVFIREHSCGFHALLVVTGPQRGTMWFDSRATCDQILPLTLHGRPVSFADWAGQDHMTPW